MLFPPSDNLGSSLFPFEPFRVESWLRFILLFPDVVFMALSCPQSSNFAASPRCYAVTCVRVVSPFSCDFSESLLGGVAVSCCLISIWFLIHSVSLELMLSHLILMRRFLVWFGSPSICCGLFYILPCDLPVLGIFPYALRKNELSSLCSEYSVGGE